MVACFLKVISGFKLSISVDCMIQHRVWSHEQLIGVPCSAACNLNYDIGWELEPRFYN